MSSEKYEFDADFQTKVCAMMLRDEPFMARVDGLIDPKYFESETEAYLADLTNSHYAKYRQIPSPSIVLQEIRDRSKAGRIKGAFLTDLKESLRVLYKDADISNRDYTVEKVSEFAQRRAIEEAILESATKLDGGAAPSELRSILNQALEVGAVDGLGGFDFLENLEERTSARVELASGTVAPKGVTTGHPKLDAELYHNGWGKGELSLLMGGPKAGKSIGLMNAALEAVKAGKNVLFVTCEVSKKIQADRADAYLSGVPMKALPTNAVSVKRSVATQMSKAGLLKVAEYPNGAFRVSDLRRLVRRYEAQSVKFDLVVVDYADIMAPEDDRLRGEIEGYKQIYMGLRATAQEEDFAVLSATQTNRGGAKARTAGKVDVAEDFNKIRLADVVLSINRDDDDKSAGRMRLHFAAHRNGEEGHSLQCQTDLSKMALVVEVDGIVS